MTKDSIENILLARRAALLNVMQSSTGDSQPVELDQSRVGRLSRMDALQGQAMAQETERRRKNELQRIENALARIKEGEYGYCVSCGEEISKKRLELDPSVPLCIDCASSG
ncbi:MAG: molecular chaperone DnaK [Sneathiella sp.]|uniref:TraR/DksA family transcriptional regulator n=1 Tax=Sneathiella sp. TaxID=1964365 RepID=UPI000C633088|nr:TraR/DksA family transcriptional regulator [Sneathiella sp.]MAZ04114.1 molecular chaperone DnaK [Sneathiella sp.]